MASEKEQELQEINHGEVTQDSIKPFCRFSVLLLSSRNFCLLTCASPGEHIHTYIMHTLHPAGSRTFMPVCVYWPGLGQNHKFNKTTYLQCFSSFFRVPLITINGCLLPKMLNISPWNTSYCLSQEIDNVIHPCMEDLTRSLTFRGLVLTKRFLWVIDLGSRQLTGFMVSLTQFQNARKRKLWEKEENKCAVMNEERSKSWTRAYGYLDSAAWKLKWMMYLYLMEVCHELEQYKYWIFLKRYA